MEILFKVFKFQIFLKKIPDNLGWRNDLKQSCNTMRDLELFCSNFFHMISFMVSRILITIPTKVIKKLCQPLDHK